MIGRRDLRVLGGCLAVACGDHAGEQRCEDEEDGEVLHFEGDLVWFFVECVGGFSRLGRWGWDLGTVRCLWLSEI